MFKLIGAVLVALVVGGMADMAARAAAEAQLEATVRQQLAGAEGVSASIAAFPFLPGLLAGGRAGDVTVRLEALPSGPLSVGPVTLAADDVEVDRDALIPGFDVEVTDVAEARFVVLVDDAELSRALGVTVAVAPGEISATVAGRRVAADAGADGSELVLDLGPLPSRRIDMPGSSVLPCAPAVRLVAGAVELSCTAADVPPALLAAAAR